MAAHLFLPETRKRLCMALLHGQTPQRCAHIECYKRAAVLQISACQLSGLDRSLAEFWASCQVLYCICAPIPIPLSYQLLNMQKGLV